MNNIDFNCILDYRINQMRETLQKKADEYSSDEDRLHNFKLAGKVKSETPQKAAWGMATKHLVSIIDMIEEFEQKPNYIPPRELVNEKFGDMINYLVLIEALIEERRRSLEAKPIKPATD